MRIARVDFNSFMMLFESDWCSCWVSRSLFILQPHKDQDQPFTGQRPQTVGLRLTVGHSLVMEDKNLDIRVIVQHTTCNNPTFNKHQNDESLS